MISQEELDIIRFEGEGGSPPPPDPRGFEREPVDDYDDVDRCMECE